MNGRNQIDLPPWCC